MSRRPRSFQGYRNSHWCMSVNARTDTSTCDPRGVTKYNSNSVSTLYSETPGDTRILKADKETAENKLDSVLPLTFSSHLILLENHNRHTSQFIFACPRCRQTPGHQTHILKHTWARMRVTAQSQHTQWLFMKLKDAPEEWSQEIQGAQICLRNNWKVWLWLVTFKADHDQPKHIRTSSSFLSRPLTSSRFTNLQHHNLQHRQSTIRLSRQNQFGNSNSL